MTLTHMPDFEPRLQRRYEKLVLGHLKDQQAVAAGVRAVVDLHDAFAATQAAWRFFANPRTTLPQLAQPLREAARSAVPQACDDFALVVHDWSQLHYNQHASKQDRVPLAHAQDLGYELQTALLLSDRDGSPIAPVFQSLRCADGVYASHTARVLAAPTKLDRLAPVMRQVRRLDLGRPAVHIIDREADSVSHYRSWARQGRLFLVRADLARQVLHEGEERLLPAVVERLREQGAFRDTREVLYHGRPHRQWVAQTEVVLHRPGKHGQGRRLERGRALPLRLVVCEVRDAAGAVLALWLLLTNVPRRVAAATVALWYYWRWLIETYFKLLKGAGLQLEHWQQETGAALAKRLLVAAMACVLVWKVSRSERPEGEQLRQILLRLSSRSMHHGVASTEPALLAGLWVLLSALALEEPYDLGQLRRLLRATFDEPETPKPPEPAPPLV